MKKIKEITADALTIPTIEEINAAGDTYAALVARYVTQFSKKTKGTKSMGEAGYSFAVNAQKRKDQFPEVLTGTFKNDDFDEKLEGVTDINSVIKRNQKINESTNEALLICKTDAAFYANVVYGLFQDAQGEAKYKTAYDELSPFYRKSKTEKVDGNAVKSPKTNLTDVGNLPTAAKEI